MDNTLHTKYRPATFEEISGQKETKSILLHQLATGEFKNAYLFVGPAGCGKTTSARAFARAINHGAGGVIEVNASSNNSVDDMRNLLEASKFKAIDAEYKVIVLDEVHALSNAAFQAFLKDLEEPAKKTIWILCTTEVQKIPATILSRVQRFDFKRISHDDVVDRLKYIVDKENEGIVLSQGGSQDALSDPVWAEREGIELIEVSDEAYDYMAKLGNGGMRASIAILDKVLGYTKKVDVDAVVNAVGTSLPEQMLKLYRMLEDRNYKGVIEAVNEIYLSGKDLRLFTADFISFVLDLSKYAITGDINLTSLPASIESDLYSDEDSNFALDLLDSLVDLGQQIKYSENPKALVESTLLLVSRG